MSTRGRYGSASKGYDALLVPKVKRRENHIAMVRGEQPPRKDDAECCNARRDHLGRLPIGYCSPECVRRPK